MLNADAPSREWFFPNKLSEFDIRQAFCVPLSAFRISIKEKWIIFLTRFQIAGRSFCIRLSSFQAR
jgi:hypothetical protein